MRNAIKIVAVAAVSAMLAVGIVGCGGNNTSSSSTNSNSSVSASASSDSASASSSAASNSNTSASKSSASNAANSNASASSSTASNSNEGRGDAEPVNGNRMGSQKVGYVTVPSDWKDFTDKLDSRTVDSTGAVYLVDPTTEFTSGVESHFAYSSSIKLETYPTKYTDIADETLYKFRGETDNYADVNIEKTTLNGKDASLVTCSSADGVDIGVIVVEKDANSCVKITVWGTPSNYNANMGYAKTWSLDK